MKAQVSATETRMTGAVFRSMRMEVGLSLNQIARMMGVDQGTVVRWQARVRLPGPAAALMWRLYNERKDAA